MFAASARLRGTFGASSGAHCAAILAGVLSLVLLTLPASPVLQMKLCPWRIAMHLRDGKRVGELCGRFAGSAPLAGDFKAKKRSITEQAPTVIGND